MKLEYTLFFVEDVAPVRDWYVEMLGLPVLENASDGKFALLGSQGGSLLGIHEGKPHASPPHVGIYFLVDDVQALYESMLAKGAKFDYAPKDMPWGRRMAETHDPAGHTVGIASAISCA